MTSALKEISQLLFIFLLTTDYVMTLSGASFVSIVCSLIDLKKEYVTKIQSTNFFKDGLILTVSDSLQELV